MDDHHEWRRSTLGEAAPYAEIIRRLEQVEEGLAQYLPRDLHAAHLETVMETIRSVRAEIHALQQADAQRRQQVLGVIGSLAVALIVLLVTSGVLTS